MRLKLVLPILAAIAALLSLGSCGTSSSSDPSVLPKQAFDRKADFICEGAGNEQIEMATTYLQQHRGASEEDLVVPAGIPPIEKEIKELRELGLPKGLEDNAKTYLEEMDAALEALKEEPKAALSLKDNPFKKADELARRLGLSDCSSNP